MPQKDMATAVRFNFLSHSLALTDRRKLQRFISYIFKKESKNLVSLECIFCSDSYLLNINRQFLSHDYYTDIITFNLAPADKFIEGEIYISLDRVRSNAKEHNEHQYIELHRVIFHGILHLCGYNDKKEPEKVLIRKKEDHYLKKYFNERSTGNFF